MRRSVKSLSGQISRRKNCAIFIIFIITNRLQGRRGEGGGRGPVRRGEEGKQGHILTQKYIVCVCS